MEKNWWKEAVVYQIYPRSFKDSNGDGIGDLNGIIEKMSYLETLGIDVIWLSPVYASPNKDMGYDISDYQAILKDFGTMEDFDRMLAAAHRHHIKIMMDLVVNHTSDQHPWFVESRKSKDNHYRDYYFWREGRAGEDSAETLPPNRWGSYFSGSAWKYDSATDMYYLHLFTPEQPDLNWDNKAVRNSVFDMMNWWCRKGIDGFRMDVISLISKTPGLPDGELRGDGYTEHTAANGPHVHDYLKEMNQKVLSKYDLITVGEAAGVTIDEAKKYANAAGSELNMVFQFEHVGEGKDGSRYGKWDADRMPLPEWKAIFAKWQNELEGRAWNSLYLSNHDQPRCVSRFGDDRPEYRVLSAKMLATCLHMMQGTPYVYQGEELGMTNVYFDDLADYRDIESINAFHDLTENQGLPAEQVMGYLKKVSRDNARTPMQWDASPNAGFTAGTPWIRVNPNYTEINAALQTEDPDSVFSYYQKLIRLRHQNESIVYGTFRLLLPEDENLFVYTRSYENETLYVLCNFTDRTVSVPAAVADAVPDTAEKLIGNYKESTKNELKPYEAAVYRII